MRHRIVLTLILLTVALMAAACGGGGGGPQGGGGQTGGGPTGGSKVSVTEREWAIEVGAVPSGNVTFAVKNNGAVEHNFIIKETGQRLDAIQPGQTKEVTATLKPGTYTIICDIAGHEEAGMKATITAK